jgi:hypothetical protein
MNSDTVNHQLDVIRKVAEEKEAELDVRAFNKYKKIFDDTVVFLKTQNVLLYGGQAIHELMPKKYKIYPPAKLPDIDVFSVNSLKVANGVVSYLKLKGYSNDTVQTRGALNKGTFKVFAEGMPILDVTDVSIATFKRLAEKSVIGSSGLRIVNPQYLRLSMHMILSQSIDAFRWEKTYQRLVNFYKVFPLKLCKQQQSRPSKITPDMIQLAYNVVKTNQYVVFGHRELEQMLGSQVPQSTKVPKVNVIVKEDAKRVAHVFLQMLRDVDDIAFQEFPEDKFMSAGVIIYYKSEPFVGIFNTTSCLTYNKIEGLNIATIHTFLRMYLSILMSTSTTLFSTYKPVFECYANALSVAHQRSGGKKRKILEEFVTSCYGPVKGLVTLRREMLQRVADKEKKPHL